MKYLHMMILYYFYNENLGGALSQYSQFSADYQEVGRRVRRIVQPHTRIPHYRAGRHHYRNVTQLTIACINNQPRLVDSLITRLGANPDIKCARKNRHSGRPDVTGLSLVFVAAEAGSDLVLRLLLSNFSLSADQPADNGFTPVFTAAQFGQNKTLAVLAEHGADFNRNFYENIFNFQQVTTS